MMVDHCTKTLIEHLKGANLGLEVESIMKNSKRAFVARKSAYISDSEYILSQLSEEEQEAAEESFSVYLRPTELYNILENRAKLNPTFLTRCLHYKLKDKHKRRVVLSVSISRHVDNGQQKGSILPLYILLARSLPIPNGETLRYSSYRFNQACKLTSSNGAQTARFILPDINKLSTDFKSGSLSILLVHSAAIINQTEIDLTEDNVFSPPNMGFCLMGKTPIDFIHFSKENSTVMSTVSMKSCYMKLSCLDAENHVCFHFPYNSEIAQIPITLTVEAHSYNNISVDKLPESRRKRTKKVIFNFKYYNNMLHKTEVTEDYTCPFCLLKCANYKGLECHLPASHDHFNYEFWVVEDYQVVNVSAEIIASSSEIVSKVISRKEKEFYFCRRPMRRTKSQTQIQNHVGPLVTNSYISGVSEQPDYELNSPTAAGASNASADIILFAPVSGTNATNQLPLLQRQRFFHSRTAQPMALEQVYAEEDSEDEVDDDIADLEDKRMLDEFVDVTQDMKEMMHLWNSFKRRQRVLADAHIPWACETFSGHHRENLVHNPKLLWCWKSFMIKLWNIGLLDAKTIDKCQSILNSHEHPNPEIEN